MLIDSEELMENIMSHEEDGYGGFTDHHIQVLQQIIESLEKESKAKNNNPDNYISIVWTVEDVQSIRPDLTADQAMEVLGKVENNHDCEFGITWDTLEFWAKELFGSIKENKQLSFKRFPKTWIGKSEDNANGDYGFVKCGDCGKRLYRCEAFLHLTKVYICGDCLKTSNDCRLCGKKLNVHNDGLCANCQD